MDGIIIPEPIDDSGTDSASISEGSWAESLTINDSGMSVLSDGGSYVYPYKLTRSKNITFNSSSGRSYSFTITIEAESYCTYKYSSAESYPPALFVRHKVYLKPNRVPLDNSGSISIDVRGVGDNGTMQSLYSVELTDEAVYNSSIKIKEGEGYFWGFYGSAGNADEDYPWTVDGVRSQSLQDYSSSGQYVSENGCVKISNIWTHVNSLYQNESSLYLTITENWYTGRWPFIQSHSDSANYYIGDQVLYVDCPRNFGIPTVVIGTPTVSANFDSVTFDISTDYYTRDGYFDGTFLVRDMDTGRYIGSSGNIRMSVGSPGTKSRSVIITPSSGFITGNSYCICAESTSYDFSTPGSQTYGIATQINPINVNYKSLGRYYWYDNQYYRDGAPRLNIYKTPFVTAGGNGVNAVFFTVNAIPVAKIERSGQDNIRDVDIGISEYAFKISSSSTSTPSNWTRTGQTFTIASDDASVIALKDPNSENYVGSINIPAPVSSNIIKAVFYKKKRHNNISVSVTAQNYGEYSSSFSYKIHVPCTSPNDITVNVSPLETIEIPLSSICNQGETTDKILRVKDSNGVSGNNALYSEYVYVDRASDGSKISIRGKNAGNCVIACDIGDSYPGRGSDNVTHCTAYVSVIVNQIPSVVLMPVLNSNSQLRFSTITSINNNLIPIALKLNDISGGRWSNITEIPYSVNVADGYSIKPDNLKTQLDNLEKNIHAVIKPVSGYINSNGVGSNAVLQNIRAAINILYPNGVPNLATSVPSFFDNAADKMYEFVQSRFDWSNSIIEALSLSATNVTNT